MVATKSKTSQKNKEETTVKVAKTVEQPVADSFTNSADEIKFEKKERSEKSQKRTLDYILGVKGATIKITQLPKGFNETELFKFFKQFGDIKGVRVDRTLNGKFSTQAFIRFFDAEVAKTARDAMNGYIMFGRKLKVDVLTGWVPHQDSFCPKSLISHASKMHMESLLESKQVEKEEMDLYNEKSIPNIASMLNDRIEKENQLKQKLKDFNINYKFTGYLDIVKSALEKPTKPTTTTAVETKKSEITKPAAKQATVAKKTVTKSK